MVGEGRGFDVSYERRQHIGHRSGLHAGRFRIQYLQYGPAVGGARNRRSHARLAERERKRWSTSRAEFEAGLGQRRAASRHYQRRHSREYRVLYRRCARTGSHGASGRRHQELARRQRHVYRQFGRAAQSNFASQQETLYTLASDTGGKALLDNNDLSMGIQQAQKDISSYYIIGYYSHNDKVDGGFRKGISRSSSP